MNKKLEATYSAYQAQCIKDYTDPTPGDPKQIDELVRKFYNLLEGTMPNTVVRVPSVRAMFLTYRDFKKTGKVRTNHTLKAKQALDPYSFSELFDSIFWGVLELPCTALWKFFRDELNIAEFTTGGDTVSEIVSLVIELATLTGPVLLHPDICIIAQKPSKISYDKTKSVVSADQEAAIQWADEYETFLFDGRVYPEKYIKLKPEDITMEIINAERNVDYVRFLVNKAGIEQLTNKYGERVKDSYITGEELYRNHPIGDYVQQGDQLFFPLDSEGNRIIDTILEYDDLSLDMKQKLKHVVTYELLDFNIKLENNEVVAQRVLSMVNPSTGTTDVNKVSHHVTNVYEAIVERNKDTRLPAKLS